ncbi:dihydrofolate reductase [Rouxiella chamberiensis]|uniref:dihydrofolate reductase n=1 Tax=Rouxiella chamberiensis TaxID=1513468 RepID=UPI00069898B0|nr:dihydrofolate reductase [Rouxiella chamberiensis]
MILISMIYTTSQDNILGHKKTIPWQAKGEQARFNAATLDKLVVMGRQTYEAQFRAHPYDNIIVLSSQPLKDAQVKWASSLDEALKIAEAEGRTEIVITGGAKLYSEAINICHVIYKSTVLVNVIGDVYGPKIPTDRFKLVWVKNIKENPSYSYQTFVTKEFESRKLTSDFGLLIP